MVELVIAAYDKDLTWLEQLDPSIKVTVYRKGTPPANTTDIFLEPNLGRCVHTFFNHIVTRYNTLADYTFFVQDYPFDHWENVIEVLNSKDPQVYEEESQLKIGGYYGYHWNSITVPSEKGGIMWQLSPSRHHDSGYVLSCNSNGYPQDNNPDLDVDKYWNTLFSEPNPELCSRYEFIPGGHFGITKEHAQLRSCKLYEEITRYLISEPVAPWIIERLECYIFNPKYKTKL